MLNESSKRLALLEQERDFLKRDTQAAKETSARRESEAGDALRMVLEKEEKIKSQRAKKKALEAHVSELRLQLQQVSTNQTN